MGDTKKKSCLRQVGTVTIPASETPFDPSAAIVTRQGLYVYGSFVDRVRKHAKSVESMGALALPYSDLETDLTDDQIVSALGKGCEFSETEVCYVIDRLTSRQPNGEDGDLLNNGYANLFYVKGGPVVYVNWRAGYRWWRVNVWRRGCIRWSRGDRVFPRN